MKRLLSLLLTAAWWGDGTRVRRVSTFLTELAESGLVRTDGWESAPEDVAGDAALTVTPGDAPALAAAIARALGEDAARLRGAGPARAAGYTWEATATRTVEVWGLACA